MRPETAAHGLVQGIKLLLLLIDRYFLSFLCHSNVLQPKLNVHIGGGEAQRFRIQTVVQQAHLRRLTYVLTSPKPL